MKDIAENKTMSSREIAKLTGKRHDNVMRDLEKIVSELNEIDEINRLKFELVKYADKKGELRKSYNLCKEASLLVVSGYSVVIRAKIIRRWQELEAANSVNENWNIQRSFCKLGYKLLCKVVEQAHEKPKFFHYSNEADLINRIVLGMSAKQYRGLNDVNTATRNTLDEITLFYINRLQAENERLIIEGIDFQTRKAKLETLHAWLSQGLLPKAEKKLKLKLVVNNED